MGELSLTEKRAWSNFVRAHASIMRRVDLAMVRDGLISFDVYDVLVTLEDAAQGRMTMSQLGERVLLTPSGVTRLVDRLVQFGYVKREPNPDDRRSCLAVLTPVGQSAREAAFPAYCAIVKREFADLICESEAEVLADLMARFVTPGIGIESWS